MEADMRPVMGASSLLQRFVSLSYKLSLETVRSDCRAVSLNAQRAVCDISEILTNRATHTGSIYIDWQHLTHILRITSNNAEEPIWSLLSGRHRSSGCSAPSPAYDTILLSAAASACCAKYRTSASESSSCSVRTGRTVCSTTALSSTGISRSSILHTLNRMLGTC